MWAWAHIAAAQSGRRGERYLAAGRNLTMRQLMPVLGRIAGVKVPSRQLPLPPLYLFGSGARGLRVPDWQAYLAEHGDVAAVDTRGAPYPL